MMLEPGNSIIRFYRLIDTARLPQRADRSAAGTLPTRAYRYCDAITSATAFGWWVFPPIDLQLLWDGHDIFWQCTGSEDWLPLLPSAQYPGMTRRFDEAAPEALAGCAPPLLTALPEPGIVQVWTGLMARTASNWSLLIRAPVNLPLPGGYSMYEGIIETDHWFGPLFTNLRLTRTHVPVRFRDDFPLAQVQPLQRLAYADTTLGVAEYVADIAEVKPSDWADYQSTIAGPNENQGRPFGAYAVASRKRRGAGCPIRTG
jgi:hypothetical protein